MPTLVLILNHDMVMWEENCKMKDMGLNILREMDVKYIKVLGQHE